MSSAEGQLRPTAPEKEETRNDVSETQMTTFNDDEIEKNVKDDIESKSESIEADVPTGKKAKRPLSEKQREALNTGRKKRHAGSKNDKPVDSEKLDDSSKQTIEKKTDTMTDDSSDKTRVLLDRLERLEQFAAKEREKRKKYKKEQELRKTLKEEIKRSMYKHGRGPVKETELVVDKDDADDYKVEQNVPARTRDRGEKPNYVDNRSLYDHSGLVSRCFG